MKKFGVSVLCMCCALVISVGSFTNVENSSAVNKEKRSEKSSGTLVEITKKEIFTGIIDGDPNGKKEILLLSSPSCEVCKRFHDDTYGALVKFAKANGIKIRLEFYIENKYALEFVKIINAIPISNHAKLSFYKSLLTHQGELLKKQKVDQVKYTYKLASDLGIKVDGVEHNKVLAKTVLARSRAIDKFVKSDIIPVISINGAELAGEKIHSIVSIKEFIKQHLQ